MTKNKPAPRSPCDIHVLSEPTETCPVCEAVHIEIRTGPKGVSRFSGSLNRGEEPANQNDRGTGYRTVSEPPIALKEKPMSLTDQVRKKFEEGTEESVQSLAKHFLANENTLRGIIVRLRREGKIEAIRKSYGVFYRAVQVV